MNYYKIYKKVIKDLDKLENGVQRFDNLYLLTALLIFNLSNAGENLDTLLKTFKEFDYKKNFGYKESKDEK